MTEAPITKSSHLRWLDSLRALAALWVVASHAFRTVGFDPLSGISRVVFTFLSLWSVPVAVFIAISGFSLALPVSRNGWCLRGSYRDFVVARFIRIVPPYYLAIALSLILVATVVGKPTGTHWDVAIPVTTMDVVKHLFLIQDVALGPGGAPKINHSLWSIGVEFKIYFLFPLLVWLVRKHGIGWATLVGLAMGTLLWFPEPLVGSRLGAFTIVFYAGMAACYFATREGKKRSHAAFLCAVLAFTAATYGSTILDERIRDLVFGVGMAFLLYALAVQGREFPVLSTRPLAALGLISYSLYLVHAPIVQIVYQLGIWNLKEPFARSMGYILLAMLASFGVAIGFFFACERPFFRHRHRIPPIPEPATEPVPVPVPED